MLLSNTVSAELVNQPEESAIILNQRDEGALLVERSQVQEVVVGDVKYGYYSEPGSLSPHLLHR